MESLRKRIAVLKEARRGVLPEGALACPECGGLAGGPCPLCRTRGFVMASDLKRRVKKERAEVAEAQAVIGLRIKTLDKWAAALKRFLENSKENLD